MKEIMNKKSLLLILLFLLIGFTIIYFTNPPEVNIPDEQENRVKLYYSTKDAMYLQAEERSIEDDTIETEMGVEKYRATIQQLIKGPQSSNLADTIPDGVELINIEVNGDTAYLNFNRALVENHWGGSTGEIMTVYSIVNTMTQFPEINRVQILIEDQEVETLVGHLDLSVPLERDNGIIKDQ
ncbi:MAG: GerMN domain-containing protein [Halanaerobiales bacterium]